MGEFLEAVKGRLVGSLLGVLEVGLCDYGFLVECGGGSCDGCGKCRSEKRRKGVEVLL